MKLVFISDDFPSKGYPMYIFVEQLVNELVVQGVEVEVIAPQSLTACYLRHTPLLPKKATVKIDSYKYDVYRPYYISLGNCPNWLQTILESLRYHGIKRILDRSEVMPDALYGHFWHNAYVVKKYAYRNSIPVFVACGEGDNALEDLISSMPQDEKERFSNAVSGVISVSSENKRKCIEYGLAIEEKIIVLPNSVDTNIFDKPTFNNKRKELGVSNEDFLIAFTGAFIHRKGSARLATSINLLNDPHIKVMFIGKKRPADDATPSCNGTVFQQALDHDEIPDYLKSADIFCLPTLDEGCSNAIVEALACGLPVVSSNLPFNRDILDGSNAILIDPMDVNQIASGIKRLKEDFNLRNQLSRGAIEKARNLKIKIRAKRIIDFINANM